MAKRMLIEATHPEETRVVVVDGTHLEAFDIETSTKRQCKGNVYLAKVIRVEPSLQAAFVDYGSSRHGFLAFSEIHPDYYHILESDWQKLPSKRISPALMVHEDDAILPQSEVTYPGHDEESQACRSLRLYKIQEVIRRRQILLVQIVKEERGNKGAALTTYLSLAGRYCVLMPNKTTNSGVSRKIISLSDRQRLKTLLTEFNIPNSMSVILRTAGAERGKTDIRRDYEYLARTWNHIREVTQRSRSPSLVYEEANLIKRAIRDLYTRDVDEIIVSGDEGYRRAKDFMKMLTPSHAKKVQRYKEKEVPLFFYYEVAAQLDSMHSAAVQLRSGGHVVFSQTEALVAIDVNSGKATRERHIEETALQTNLEAAEEIARQLRLRDLAGLIVIDFIDMAEVHNNITVENRLKEETKSDRARIQIGRISPFGLMELSRQRLRPSLMETDFQTCPHCNGTGSLRSLESSAMHVLRGIEEEGLRHRSLELSVTCPSAVALYILNHKRLALANLETRYGFHVLVFSDGSLVPPAYRMERLKGECEEVDIAPDRLLENEDFFVDGKDGESRAPEWQQCELRNGSKWLNGLADMAPLEWEESHPDESPDESNVMSEKALLTEEKGNHAYHHSEEKMSSRRRRWPRRRRRQSPALDNEIPKILVGGESVLAVPTASEVPEKKMDASLEHGRTVPDVPEADRSLLIGPGLARFPMHYSLLRPSVMTLHNNQTDGSEVKENEVNAVYKDDIDMPMDHKKESVTTSVMTNEEEHYIDKKKSKVENKMPIRRIGWWMRKS